MLVDVQIMGKDATRPFTGVVDVPDMNLSERDIKFAAGWILFQELGLIETIDMTTRNDWIRSAVRKGTIRIRDSHGTDTTY